MLRTLTLTLCVVFGYAADGGAAILKVPQQFPKIQQAVDAASSGDTVRVSAGIYREAVVIMNKVVRLEGKGAAIIEGRSGGVNLGAGITIGGLSSGTVVKGITIRLCMSTGNSGAGIVAVASDLTFDTVRVIGCGGPGIVVTGQNITVKKCVIEGCDGGIDATAGGIHIDSCVVKHDASRGIRVTGADFFIRKCIVDTIETGYGIHLDAFSGTVEHCVIKRIQTNTGLFIDGANVFASNNVISDVGNDAVAVRVSAANVLFEHNVVRDVVAQGIFVDPLATDAIVHANQFLRNATESEAAIHVAGATCAVTSNVIKEADGPGIRIAANQAYVASNKIDKCRSDGIRVDVAMTGVTLTGNRYMGQLGEGIDVRATGTLVTGNIAKLNRTDFVTSVMNFVIDPSNAFGTTGLSEID